MRIRGKSEMTQIRENWTDVRGTVVGVSGSTKRPLFAEVSILVDEARPVSGFENFLGNAAGRTVVVNVPADTVRALPMNEGVKIRCRVRRGRGPNDLFAKAGSVAVRRHRSKDGRG